MSVPTEPRLGDIIGSWEVLEVRSRRGSLCTAAVKKRENTGPHAIVVLHHHADGAQAQAEAAELAPMLDLELEGFDTILDLGLHGTMCWWVRPMRPGRPLDQAAMAIADIQSRCAALRMWGAHAARVLAGLHAQGICHGALGVDAVRVDQAGAVSLGAVREGHRASGSSAVAPEQLTGQAPRPEADVYGLAAALHIALSEGPAGQDTVTTPWGGGAREPTPSPALVRPDADLDLCEILDNALSLSPVRRPTAAELARALSRPPRSGAPGPRCPQTFGRDQLLDPMVTRLRGTGPSFTLARGPFGSGRHQVVDAVLRRALRDQAQLIFVEARPDRPGSAIQALLDAAIRRNADPRTLGEDGPVLWTLWPELPGVGEQTTGEVEATALIAAATRVLARAAGAHPLVLVVDQLEQADPLTLRALSRIARQGGPRIHVIGIVDDRSPPGHVRRWLRRVEGSDLAHQLTLPDLPSDLTSRIACTVFPFASPALDAPAGSPLRAVELGHQALFQSRGETHRPPAEALRTLAVHPAPLPRATLRALGIDVEQGIAEGHLRTGPGPEDVELSPRVQAWCAARLSGLAVAHDAVANAIAATSSTGADCRWEAWHRLLGTHPEAARGPLALAAAEALDGERPERAWEWLHTIDRLGSASPPLKQRTPGPEDTPSARALRARLRAELSLRNRRAAPRAALLDQFRRRARTPADHAHARVLDGWLRVRQGKLDAAAKAWRGVAVDPGAPAAQRARAARLWTEASLQLGLVDDATAAVAVARAAAQLSVNQDAPLDAALAALELHAAQGDARAIADKADRALVHATNRPLSAARIRLLRARASRALDDAGAAQDDLLVALSHLPRTRAARAVRLGLHVLQAHLSLDRGAPERARHLLRRTHGELADLDSFDADDLLARWWAAALRLSAWCAEHPTAAGLLQSVPSPIRPASRAVVLEARLAYSRCDPDAARAAQTRALATPALPSVAEAATAHLHAAMTLLFEGPRDALRFHASEARHIAEKAGARDLVLQAQLLQAVDVNVPNRWAYLAARARTGAKVSLRADASAIAAVLAMRTSDPGGAAQALLQLHAELEGSRNLGLRDWALRLEDWLAVEDTTVI